LREQKLNDFSVGEAKIGGKTIKTINAFKKGIRSVQWGLGQSPRSWGIFENFVLKVTLQSVSLAVSASYRKIGSRMY